MKSKSYSAMGALHPILFFAVMYVVVLFLSIFICSSIFYSFNGSSSDSEAGFESARTGQMTAANKGGGLPVQVSGAVVVR